MRKCKYSLAAINRAADPDSGVLVGSGFQNTVGSGPGLKEIRLDPDPVGT